MNFLPTPLSGVCVIEPRVFEDPRGFFMETYHQAKFAAGGIPVDFVQDNHSASRRGTLRGLHYQTQHPQGKLVRAISGEVFDVAVDLRKYSPTFGRWHGVTLSAENRRQLYVCPGMAHGFCVVSETAEIVYKCTDFWYPEFERSIAWNDPELAVAWPIAEPILSEKDRKGSSFADAVYYE